MVNELEEVNVETINRLGYREKLQAKAMIVDWLIKQRQTDKEMLHKETIKIRNFKRKWKTLYHTKIYINTNYIMEYTVTICIKTKSVNENFY